MIDAFFTAFGNIFATGAGILLLAVLTGAIFVLWDWRIALAGVVLVHLGSSSVLVLVHGVPGIIAAGQLLAIVVSAAMLAIAGLLHPHPTSLRQAGNWPLRLMALTFIVVAWWYLDPGYTLPSFSQAETDFLLWTAMCALALWSFSGSPLLGGVGVLLWSVPMYSLAAVLLPGSGLPAIIGITDIVLALACSYLVLLEPAGSRGVTSRLAIKNLAATIAPQPLRPRETLPPVAAGSPITPDTVQKKAA
jgi:hypothetical protein